MFCSAPCPSRTPAAPACVQRIASTHRLTRATVHVLDKSRRACFDDAAAHRERRQQHTRQQDCRCTISHRSGGTRSATHAGGRDMSGAHSVAVLLQGGLVLQVGPARRQTPRLSVDVQRAVHPRLPDNTSQMLRLRVPSGQHYMTSCWRCKVMQPVHPAIDTFCSPVFLSRTITCRSSIRAPC